MRRYITLCLAIILMVSISMCTSTGNGINKNSSIPGPTPTNFTPEENATDNGLAEKTVIISGSGGEISRDVCIAKGIERRVIVLYATGCPACAVAVPRLQELDEEMDMEFEFLDFAASESQERINELNLLPEKIPTVVIGCNAYVGAMTKDTYRELIEAI